MSEFKIEFQGSSMWPFLQTGDQLIVKNQSHYKLGDILVIKDEHEFIVHRLITDNNDLTYTKGDFSLNKELATKILGKVIGFDPQFYFPSFLHFFFSINAKLSSCLLKKNSFVTRKILKMALFIIALSTRYLVRIHGKGTKIFLRYSRS